MTNVLISNAVQASGATGSGILSPLLGGVASVAGSCISAHIQRKTALMIQDWVNERARIEGDLNRAAAWDQLREKLSQD